MSDRPVLALFLGDVVRLRRSHPCGSHEWLVDRLGADIGLRCQGCSRHVLLERAVLERRLTGFVSRGDPAVTAAVGGPAASDARPSDARRSDARRSPNRSEPPS